MEPSNYCCSIITSSPVCACIRNELEFIDPAIAASKFWEGQNVGTRQLAFFERGALMIW